MSFFGLTTLGSGTAFETSKANVLHRLAKIPPETFTSAFMHYCLDTKDKLLAKEIQVDGKLFMQRENLNSVLRMVLKQEMPTREEMDAFLTFFDTTTSGIIDSMEFGDALRKLMERAKNPSNPKHYKSNLHFREDRHRHKRLEDDPMAYFSKPVTSSQSIGWHTQQANPSQDAPSRKYYPILSTEITQKEGRSLEDYFGAF